MDTISLGFYALVCGALNVVGPFMGGFISRFSIGVVVGLVAAWALPLLKTAVGFGY
jgi:hypothetical protein